MADIILHHYPNSPFSEKARVTLGLKGLSWHSVVTPMMLPKPDLMPLTGGYRKAPVMQIGADIYCDTQCILRELERRHPTPSLHPGGNEGQNWALGFWADRSLFWTAVDVVFGNRGGAMPQAYRDDRAKFTGRDLDPEKMKAALPRSMDQLRAHLGWAEQMLADGRAYLLGEQAGMADIAVYNAVWFLTRNMGADFSLFAELPRLVAWRGRMEAIGNGNASEMDAKEALKIAREATPATPRAEDSADPGGRKPGDRITVTPDDTGRDPVAGTLIALNAQEIVIGRQDPEVGEVALHFPRAGFVVTPA